MSENALQLQTELTTSTVSVEGLEEFFSESTGTPTDAGLTVKEAAAYFKLPAKKIRKGIESGEIPATRLVSEKGEKFRVYPHGVPDHLTTLKFAPQPTKLTKEEQLALKKDVDSIKKNVLELNQQIGSLCDSVAELNHELIAIKQIMARVGVHATWVDQNAIHVEVERPVIDRFPTNALITVNPIDASICTVDTEVDCTECNTTKPRKRGIFSAIGRWLFG